MSWPFHLNDDGSTTVFNPLWPIERRKAARALSNAEENLNVTTKPALATKDRRFDTPEEKEAFLAARQIKEAVKPPTPPPAERRSTATSAPEPRKRSLDEVLNGGRVLPPSRLDMILAGRSLKDAAPPDADPLTAGQRAAWDALDALMAAGVTGDTLTNAVVAFADLLQGED